LGGYGYLPPKDAFPKAIRAASKAIELNDRLSEAHAARGFSSFFYEWNWSQSEQEFQRALALDPDNALAHSWHGIFLRSLGRVDEATAEGKLAEALDPTSPIMPFSLGLVFITARRYEEAITALTRALELEPGLVVAHEFLAEAYMLSGNGDLAIQEGRRALDLGTPGTRWLLAAAYLVAGKKTDAMDMLEKAVDEARPANGSAAFLAAGLSVFGDTDRAFGYLERAYSDHEYLMVLLNVQPEFDALRADPRFSDLVRRVGIPSR
jgi:Tfp pilus assembly protein PilF